MEINCHCKFRVINYECRYNSVCRTQTRDSSYKLSSFPTAFEVLVFEVCWEGGGGFLSCNNTVKILLSAKWQSSTKIFLPELIIVFASNFCNHEVFFFFLKCWKKKVYSFIIKFEIFEGAKMKSSLFMVNWLIIR